MACEAESLTRRDMGEPETERNSCHPRENGTGGPHYSNEGSQRENALKPFAWRWRAHSSGRLWKLGLALPGGACCLSKAGR